MGENRGPIELEQENEADHYQVHCFMQYATQKAEFPTITQYEFRL